MVEVFPRRNLGAAEDWGRRVENRIEGAERRLALLQQTVENLGRTSAAQLSRNASQIEDTQRLIQGLQIQQDALHDVVASLAESDSQSARITGFSIPNGISNRMTLTFPVPGDKVRCTVFAVGQAMYYAPVPNASVAAWRVRIGTVDGPFGSVVPLNMDVKSTTFMFARTFTVTPESNVSVYARTSAGAAHPTESTNDASIFALATFDRPPA